MPAPKNPQTQAATEQRKANALNRRLLAAWLLLRATPGWDAVSPEGREGGEAVVNVRTILELFPETRRYLIRYLGEDHPALKDL